MILGEVIKRWREAEGLGVREFAVTIGVTHNTISRMERGENIDGETLAKVLTWLVQKTDGTPVKKRAKSYTANRI